MQRTNSMVLGLVAVFVLGGSLALLGCSSDDEEIINISDQGTATAELGGRSFTFPDATAFSIPVNTPATVTLSPDANRFAISAAPGGTARRATGRMSYGSCTFNVGTSTNPDAPVVAGSNPNGGGSNFPSGQGPQPSQGITAGTCETNDADDTLTVTIGNTTATSNPPVVSGSISN